MWFKKFFLKIKDCVLCRSKCVSSCCSDNDEHEPQMAPVITITGSGSPIINIRNVHVDKDSHHEDDDG